MEKELCSFLRKLSAAGTRANVPNISFETAEILRFFLRISAARHIFEIGCANGFSTIFLAAHARACGGKVVTCDLSAPSFAAARENLQQVGLQDYVDFRFGDALQILKASERFDFIFIDGQKNRTHEFFLLAAAHLAPQGVIAIDDTGKFPEKMAAFSVLRTQRKDFLFLDIPVDGDDAVTVAFWKE